MDTSGQSSNKVPISAIDPDAIAEKRSKLTDDLASKKKLEKKLKVFIIMMLSILFIVSLFLIYQYFVKLGEPPKNYFELQLRTFRAYTAAYPKSPEAHANLGFIYYRMEDLESAKKEFEIAIKLDKNNLTGNFFLGEVYKKQNNDDKAILYLGRAATIASPTKKYTALYELGEIYEKKGDYDKAFNLYKASADDNSTTWNSHYKLGTIYERRNQPANALAEYKRALVFNPKNENLINAIAKLESQAKTQK